MSLHSRGRRGSLVAGVRVAYGIYTEWHSYGMYEAPDTGTAMTAHFRNWLRSKYSSYDALASTGAHAYVKPGSYFRRHGDVFMFNTGTKGRHVITLPECDRGAHVVELFSGVRMPAADIAVDSDGAGTWFFKLAKRSFLP